MTTSKRFAAHFRTFEEWSEHAKSSRYSQEIRRRHFLYPAASLAQLSGRPSTGEKPLHKLRPRQLWELLPSALSARNRRMRVETLGVVSRMRNMDETLSTAVAETRVREQDVLKHAGGALRKIKGEYYAKVEDRIPRSMKINHGGNETIIVVDSKNASVIGAYHAAVKRFLNTGDRSTLEPFVEVSIADLEGSRYKLDVEPRVVQAIEERREEPEFYSIYEI